MASKHQSTVLERLLSSGPTLEVLLTGMARVSTLLYVPSPELSNEIERTRAHLKSFSEHLQYETELAYGCSAHEALSLLDERDIGHLAKLLAQADQLLGRRTFLRAFVDQ